MNYTWLLDTFDTDIFGFKIAKVKHIDILKEISEQIALIEKLKKELIQSGIQYASYRVEAKAFSLIHALEKAGFLLVDGLVSLEKIISRDEVEKIPNVRQALSLDSRVLKEIAGKSFVINRFYQDSLFVEHKDKIQVFYAKWIENCLRREAADMVLVKEEGGRVKGFIAFQKNGHITLLAVSESERGRGVSRDLIKASFETFLSWKVETVRIETVITNIPALRAYQACGFRITGSHITLRWHKND